MAEKPIEREREGADLSIIVDLSEKCWLGNDRPGELYGAWALTRYSRKRRHVLRRTHLWQVAGLQAAGSRAAGLSQMKQDETTKGDISTMMIDKS